LCHSLVPKKPPTAYLIKNSLKLIKNNDKRFILNALIIKNNQRTIFFSNALKNDENDLLPRLLLLLSSTRLKAFFFRCRWLLALGVDVVRLLLPLPLEASRRRREARGERGQRVCAFSTAVAFCGWSAGVEEDPLLLLDVAKRWKTKGKRTKTEERRLVTVTATIGLINEKEDGKFGRIYQFFYLNY
jgi:hypothetical protein